MEKIHTFILLCKAQDRKPAQRCPVFEALQRITTFERPGIQSGLSFFISNAFLPSLLFTARFV
jgi:hypothetical protein